MIRSVVARMDRSDASFHCSLHDPELLGRDDGGSRGAIECHLRVVSVLNFGIHQAVPDSNAGKIDLERRVFVVEPNPVRTSWDIMPRTGGKEKEASVTGLHRMPRKITH